MAKLCVPQSLCAGIDVGGRRYRAKNGYLEVPDHLVKHLKRNAECFDPSQPLRAVDGFVCEDCGFNAFFRTCGRCGGVCRRPHDLKEKANGQA